MLSFNLRSRGTDSIAALSPWVEALEVLGSRSIRILFASTPTHVKVAYAAVADDEEDEEEA
jgi:hypothetical protein